MEGKIADDETSTFNTVRLNTTKPTLISGLFAVLKRPYDILARMRSMHPWRCAHAAVSDLT
jgi:hypothetical protein